MMQCTHACESQGQAEVGVTVADHAAHARSRHVGTTRDGRLMAVIQMAYVKLIHRFGTPASQAATNALPAFARQTAPLPRRHPHRVGEHTPERCHGSISD